MAWNGDNRCCFVITTGRVWGKEGFGVALLLSEGMAKAGIQQSQFQLIPEVSQKFASKASQKSDKSGTEQ